MISFYDLPAIDSLRQELKFDPHCVHRARVAFFKKSLGPEAALAEIPESKRRAFAEAVSFRPLALDRRFDSSLDGATKLVSKTDMGFAIESVILRPSTGRVTLCVSSQVGCAAACAFCATGHMGVARSLSAAEILAQVTLANESLAAEGRRARNLVFMGMGEPLHNEEAVCETLTVLQSSQGFDHAPSRILMSTVGIPDAMVRVAEAFPTTNFALSLHAARAEVRERIVPLARKHRLPDLQAAIQRLNAIQPEKTSVMIEHVMLDGVNDSEADADALIAWLGGLRVHVNLIPYNAIEAAPELRASPREKIEAFGALVRGAGFPTTIRYSLGSDIDAACGQLVRDENRQVAKRMAAESATPGSSSP